MRSCSPPAGGARHRVVAGAASALALAPFNALAGAVSHIPGSGLAGRRLGAPAAGAASGAPSRAGWCFGFGYFVAGLYWVGYAFLVDAKTFGWLLPIAVAGLPAYLAIYTGARPRDRRG